MFQSVLSWLEYDRKSRQQYTETLLRSVRLPLLAPSDIVDHVETVEYLMNNSSCQQFVKEALHYHCLPARQSLLQVRHLKSFTRQGIHGTGKTRKTGKMAKRNSLSVKTQGIWKFCQNTGNFVYSSCKFPYSKGKRYFGFCREYFYYFFSSWISLPSQFCVSHCYKSRRLPQGE